MMKSNSDINTTTTSAVACGNCGVEERRFLHNVRHRGSFRRLCTSCVLRLHPHSFCPTCFHVYDHSPPSTDAVTCFKCYSSSHSHCVAAGVTSPYVCPLCSNPNAPIFVAKKAGEGKSYREIDKKSAGILFSAARIASISMSKAAVGARAEAERRVKEAAFTRKRAREALEHVASLVTKDKVKKTVENSGSGNVVMNYRSNIGGASMVKPELNRIRPNPIGNNQRVVDSSSEVLAALNAVELKEKEKEKERLQVYAKPQSVISVAPPPPVQCVPMDVENHNKLGVNSVQNVEGTNASSAHFDKQNSHVGEIVSNGLHCVPPSDLIGSDHVKEEKNGPQE